MELIASADNAWGIGRDGELLFTVPADMKRFRALTIGNIVVMGKATCLSLPRGPLPHRENIVLSRDENFAREGFAVLRSIPALREYLQAKAENRKVFLIGGQQIYEQLLPYCRKAHITRFHADFPADRFLPDLEADPAWELESIQAGGEHEGIKYDFRTYIRKV